MVTVVHEQSLIGLARRELADATDAATAAAALVPPLEVERDTAQARLAHLEALPVDLKKFDRDRELEIASLRRGLAQLQTRIDSATMKAANAEKVRVVAAREAGQLQFRLNEAERKLALLADLDFHETAVLRIMDHRFMVGQQTQELLAVTSAPDAPATATSNVAAAA